VYPAYFTPDLDGDGRGEALVLGMIWENMGNDSNELVWRTRECGFHVFGDFSKDGRLELAGGAPPQVWECTGDDQYVRVYKDTAYFPASISEMLMTNDIDRNGRPEFYVTYYSYSLSRMWLRMYQDESDGGHQFTRTMVDSLRFGKGDVYVQSACGDIDGDGTDECVWTTPESVRAYKAFGDNDLRRAWELQLDPGPVNVNTWTTSIYDVNGDGYNEWMLACDSISIFEVDAVDLLSPNNGTYKIGDTIPIRWAANTPPRCDSLSLFLRRDSLWSLDTIAAGLPGTDTLYRWVVPSGVPETARVVVIAYGPGHQYDISDSVIYLTGGGVAEDARRLYVTRLRDCSPNPLGRATTVSYELARGGSVALSVHDVSGRLVRRLEDGFRSAGPNSVAWNGTDSRGMAVPAGVYFVRFSANGVTQSRRVTLVR
jgi:hypothetical protein